MATITSYYVRRAVFAAERQGLDVEQLILNAGIDRQVLDKPGSRVTDTQMTSLVQQIWIGLSDEFMGFTEQPSKLGSFAMMCQLVSHCDNVNTLFQQGIKFYQLLTDDIVMDYQHTDDGVEFHARMANPELDPDHFYLEFWLIIWHRFASWMIGKKIKLKSIYFDYPEPPHVAEFDSQFSCECHFNAGVTKFCFAPQYAVMPLVRTQRELAHFLKDSPAGLMVIPGEDDSLSLKIKTLLLENAEKQQDFPAFEIVASLFNTSPQALRRHLKEEGSSYQKMKDAIRRDVAIEKICIQNMTINDVAALLGFSEPRSFTRAFKHWTGMTPSMYRKRIKT